ncbi:MAG: hypothetical protein MI757_10055 [Pirellulales bacterium]|nr:hypothetical protein [Pirellulales bacterium]
MATYMYFYSLNNYFSGFHTFLEGKMMCNSAMTKSRHSWRADRLHTFGLTSIRPSANQEHHMFMNLQNTSANSFTFSPRINTMSKNTITATFAAIIFIAYAAPAVAVPVTLQNPTATYEQGGWPITDTLDGMLGTGWAFDGGQTSTQTGVYQTVSPLSATGLQFTLTFGTNFAGHKFQDIVLSYTTDAAPTTVSGATWNELTPTTAAADEATTAIMGNHIEFTGSNAVPDVYTIEVTGINLTGVTGFRLQAFVGDNGDLGFTGDGDNGNVVLSEFQVDTVVPEPSTCLLGTIGCIAFVAGRRRRERRS